MGGEYVTIKNYPTISRMRHAAAADAAGAVDCEQPFKGADAEDAKPVRMMMGEGITGITP
jgi:hypothetical protein